MRHYWRGARCLAHIGHQQHLQCQISGESARAPGKRMHGWFGIIYTCTYLCVYTCTYLCVYACTYLCVYTCTYLCVYTCTYLCVYTCTYLCVYTCTYLCVYTCTYLCVYIVFQSFSLHGVYVRLLKCIYGIRVTTNICKQAKKHVWELA